MPEEIALADTIESLEERRREVNREIDIQLAEINQKQVEVSLAVNQSRRRLITAQGDELVDELASVFKIFGFGVQKVDESIEQSESRREDLRLTDPENPDWEAIVEVRGYSRSSSQNQDFLRLARFATMYLKDKGKLPDQRILVVNGEIEIAQPSRRQLPYAAAKDDVEEFARDDGLVIWSLDLFQQVKRIGEISTDTIRKSIIEARGRWRGLEL
jgi:hypothetical protein